MLSVAEGAVEASLRERRCTLDAHPRDSSASLGVTNKGQVAAQEGRKKLLEFPPMAIRP